MTPRRSLRPWVVATSVAVTGVAALVWRTDPLTARTAFLVVTTLILWLSESVPAFVPTLVLLAGAPLLLGPLGESFRLTPILGAAASPVLALFFGGFVLGAAASRYGIDAAVTRLALRHAGSRCLVLLAIVMGATALLSMWMSNIAAAAMMLGALRPLLDDRVSSAPFRKALLMGTALGANLGGMATPVGTGPNAIAIAEVAGRLRITFAGWMSFALPLTIVMMVLGFVLVARRYRVAGRFDPPATAGPAARPGAGAVVAVFLTTVALWLSEPIHGVPAAVIALAAAAALFTSGLMGREDLARLDWSTLVLIAGGLVLGRILETSGFVERIAAGLGLAGLPPVPRLLVLVGWSAALASVMSNTATAAMLIPFALRLDPDPSTAVLIALGASFGIPFVISTPPNAMIHGQAGITGRDLRAIGLPVMVAGCLLIAISGAQVLRLVGIR